MNKHKLWFAAGLFIASLLAFGLLDFLIEREWVSEMGYFDWFIFTITGKGWLFASSDIIFWTVFGGAISLLVASAYLCLSHFLHGKLTTSASNN